MGNDSSVKNSFANQIKTGKTDQFNSFVPNAPFLYPLETSDNRKVF